MARTPKGGTLINGVTQLGPFRFSGRRGQRARHFFLYRVADDGVVEVARFLYDGMDLAQHLPPDYEARPLEEGREG